jgi:predicted metal-dependent hydrolase
VTELRDDIATALEREHDRLERRTIKTEGVKERMATIHDLLETLENERPCFLKIEPELRPEEIRLD